MDSEPHGSLRHHYAPSFQQTSAGGSLCRQHYISNGGTEYNTTTITNPEAGSDTNQMNLKSHNTLQNDQHEPYELSQDRRKRRKISQEPELKSEHNLRAGVEEGTRADQGPIAEWSIGTSNVGQVQTAIGSQANHQGQDEISKTVSSAAKPGKRGRPPKSAVKHQNLKAPVASEIRDGQEEQDAQMSPKVASSPRKRTMKISADGKLFGLSKKPPPQVSSVSVETSSPAKGAYGGKNLAMKNGKLTQKLTVTLKYGGPARDGNNIGAKVEQILSGQIRLHERHNQIRPEDTIKEAKPASKSTHPFFLAKTAQLQVPATQDTTTTVTTDNVNAEVKRPIAWKDLAFKSKNPTGSKTIISEKPLWPPLPYQHVGVVQTRRDVPENKIIAYGKRKSKMRMDHIAEGESILSSYVRNKIGGEHATNDLTPPGKVLGTASQVLTSSLCQHELQNNIRVVSTMRTKMLQGSSAFDRAEPSGPYPWTQQHCPTMWEEVLQSTSHILFEWLSGLAVHNVKQGLDPKQGKQTSRRRKRPKKRNEEFADFIDFDDESQDTTKIKNAILIVGPIGCGKTASVFAVAKQLGFEVFEIHSGMRRSQRDIFEKVGDMTQNHMVQRGQNASRDSSVLHDTDISSSQEETPQPSLTSFLAPPGKKTLLSTPRAATPQPNKQTQKQSLILIEEVDHVFEDDRGFWSGVHALIQNSKRPVVLTCNDTQDVPLNELDLFTTLLYTTPPTDIVTEYLCYMAAAEGHIVQPDAIRALYESKCHDLRATITELQFWCQMGVGSTQGGLDWFPSHKYKFASETESSIRTFSKDTFRTGLDLQPVRSLGLEKELKFASDDLDISYDNLLGLSFTNGKDHSSTPVETQQALEFLEARSDAECVHPAVQPLLYSVAAAAMPIVNKDIDRLRILEAKIRSSAAQQNGAVVNYSFLNALAVESSIYSLGHGRLAPSLDSPRSVLACDMTPYIRSIVSYDLDLEQQRDEIYSSQGKKSRTTRAARAAAEGGDKASTRRDRWFTESLDVQAVLKTGNQWPRWSRNQHPIFEEDEMERGHEA